MTEKSSYMFFEEIKLRRLCLYGKVEAEKSMDFEKFGNLTIEGNFIKRIQFFG